MEFPERVRWVFVRGLAATVAGTLVLGVGGRLAMLGSRLIHPDAMGRITENGNRIGEFTLDGTIELIVFGGFLSGLAAGVVWVALRRWVPENHLAVGLVVVTLGGFQLIDAQNIDFAILGNPAPDVALLLSLLFAMGVTVSILDRVFERRLPGTDRPGRAIWYAIPVFAVSPLAIPVFGSYLVDEYCTCGNPPVWAGVSLLALAVLTLWSWVRELYGKEVPQRLVSSAGLLVAFAAVAGAVHLGAEVVEIL